MEIYIHLHGKVEWLAIDSIRRKLLPTGSKDTQHGMFTLHPWMGRDDADAMHNWRLYAQHMGLNPDDHQTMKIVTDQIVAHLDLIRQLDREATFRDESLYCIVHSFGGEDCDFFIVKSRDQDQAREDYLSRYTSEAGRRAAEDGLRGVVNIGEPIAALKHKIEQYFGVQAA